MPLWEVEGLWLAIWEHPIGHLNSLLQLLSIRTINGVATIVHHINFHKPVCLLLWLLGVRLWDILRHVLSGEGAW